MRKSFVLLGIAAVLIPASSIAQMAGGAPSGPTPDIRNSDLGAHDSVSNPDAHELLVRERERELSEQVRALNSAGRSRPAKASELIVGAAVNDKSGVSIAKIDEVDPDGVILTSALNRKVKVPVDAFGHNKAGLLLDMTKAQFDQVVAKASAGPNG